MNRNQINCLFEKTPNILYANLDISRLAFTTSLTSHRWRLHGGSKHCPSQKYNTKEVPCHNTLKKERNKLSSSTSNFDATSEQCHVGIQLVICFAKTSQLFNANHWNTSALAQKIGCRFPFAKVLDAVENSRHFLDEKKHALWCSSWNWLVIQVRQAWYPPENSRAVPGKEQVSKEYEVCHTKFVLLMSKQEIAENFKKVYPELWEIHLNTWISSISQEFPAFLPSSIPSPHHSYHKRYGEKH